jgi:hypothetical protein
VLDTLNDSWQAFSDAAMWKDDQEEEGPKKKKQKEVEDAIVMDSNSEYLSGYDVDSLAVSFSLQAYLVLLVLSNLSMQNLTEDSATSVRRVVSDFREQTVPRALEKLLKTKRLLPSSGKKKRRRESLAAGRDRWGMQVVATAMLRIEYALDVAKEFSVGGEKESMGKVVEQAKEIINKEGGIIPELELEIVSDFLMHLYQVLTPVL